MAHVETLVTARAARIIRSSAAVAACIAAAGCANLIPERGSPLPPHASVRSARTTLGDAEIAAAGLPPATSLLAAIGRLRPEFLHGTPRNASGAPEVPVVYVDGVRVGDLTSLRDIPANAVLDVRLLRRTEAPALLGSSTSGARLAIAVRLRRAG